MTFYKAALAVAVFAISCVLLSTASEPCPSSDTATETCRLPNMALSIFRNDLSDSPFGSLLSFPDIFSTLVDAGPARRFLTDSQAMLSTQVDVKESPDSYEFIADLPGLKPENVKVQLEDGNILAISGERQRETKGDDQYHRVERSVGRFLRRFRLPDNADTEKIQAKFENGELHITVPKKQKDEKKQETKEIPILKGSKGGDKPQIEGSK